jgi:hypothetical protein
VVLEGSGVPPNMGSFGSATDHSGTTDNRELTLLPYRLYNTDGNDYRNPSIINKAVEDFLNNTTIPLAPFTAIRVCDNSILYAQDHLGSGRAYLYNKDGLVIFTNSVHACLKTIGKSLDYDSLLSVVACQWMIDKTTMHSDFRALQGGERGSFVINQNNVELTHLKTFGLTKYLNKSPLDAKESIIKNMEGLTRSIDNTEPELRMGLTGGRDSRLLAAFFRNTNINYYTINKFSEETEIAKLLTNLINQSGNHTIRNTGALATKARKWDYDVVEYSRSYAALYDGRQVPYYIGINPPISSDPFLTYSNVLSISGANGEMLHGHYYPKSECSISSGLDRDQSIDLIIKRLGINRHLHECFRNVFINRLRNILLNINLDFNDPIRITDYFYAFEKQSTWSSFSGSSNIVAPLAHPSFVYDTFSLEYSDILTNSIIKDLTISMVPVWKDVDYFKGNLGQKNNQPEWTIGDAQNAMNYIQSFDIVNRFIDTKSLRQILDKWGNLTPIARELPIKRALWCATLVELFN